MKCAKWPQDNSILENAWQVSFKSKAQANELCWHKAPGLDSRFFFWLVVCFIKVLRKPESARPNVKKTSKSIKREGYASCNVNKNQKRTAPERAAGYDVSLQLSVARYPPKGNTSRQHLSAETQRKRNLSCVARTGTQNDQEGGKRWTFLPQI